MIDLDELQRCYDASTGPEYYRSGAEASKVIESFPLVLAELRAARAEIAALQQQIEGHAARIASQSDQLSRNAEARANQAAFARE